jgi:hypothetical protein
VLIFGGWGVAFAGGECSGNVGQGWKGLEGVGADSGLNLVGMGKGKRGRWGWEKRWG